MNRLREPDDGLSLRLGCEAFEIDARARRLPRVAVGRGALGFDAIAVFGTIQVERKAGNAVRARRDRKRAAHVGQFRAGGFAFVVCLLLLGVGGGAADVAGGIARGDISDASSMGEFGVPVIVRLTGTPPRTVPSGRLTATTAPPLGPARRNRATSLTENEQAAAVGNPRAVATRM
jgi:hypothetical protein